MKSKSRRSPTWVGFVLEWHRRQSNRGRDRDRRRRPRGNCHSRPAWESVRRL